MVLFSCKLSFLSTVSPPKSYKFWGFKRVVKFVSQARREENAILERKFPIWMRRYFLNPSALARSWGLSDSVWYLTNVRGSSIVLIAVQNTVNENLYCRTFQKGKQSWNLLILSPLVKQKYFYWGQKWAWTSAILNCPDSSYNQSNVTHLHQMRSWPRSLQGTTGRQNSHSAPQVKHIVKRLLIKSDYNLFSWCEIYLTLLLLANSYVGHEQCSYDTWVGFALQIKMPRLICIHMSVSMWAGI